MKVALDKVIEIVTECKPNGETDISSISIFTGIKEFKVSMERMYFGFFLPFYFILLIYFIFCLLRAIPKAYRSSQASI